MVHWLRQTFTLAAFQRSNALLMMFTALLYIASARVSQVFAIEPGNITPVWIPSGLMLAMALHYGARIWPGVFIGAFVGNVWAYFSSESATTIARALASGTFNGIGDVLSVVLAALLIKRFTHKNSAFDSLKGFVLFGLIGAVLGPLASALMGVGGLHLFGFVDAQNVTSAFSTWWVGDGVGVILFAPLTLSLIDTQRRASPYFLLALVFCVLVFAAATATLFSLIEPFLWLIALWVLLVPVAFVVMLYAGQRLVFIVQVVISGIAIITTYLGIGPFVTFDILSPLMSLQLFVGMFSCVLFALAVVVNQKQLMTEKLQMQTEELQSLYRRDALTGLWNRYRIEEFLNFEVNKLKRSGPSFAVFLIDIDGFKAINDQNGHLEGDRILREISELMSKQIRQSDLFGRWGGEEFIVIAPEANVDDAEALAHKLVKLVARHDFGLEQPVTISIGLSMSQHGDSSMAILHRADTALYRAKSQGKNQYMTQT